MHSGFQALRTAWSIRAAITGPECAARCRRFDGRRAHRLDLERLPRATRTVGTLAVRPLQHRRRDVRAGGPAIQLVWRRRLAGGTRLHGHGTGGPRSCRNGSAAPNTRSRFEGRPSAHKYNPGFNLPPRGLVGGPAAGSARAARRIRRSTRAPSREVLGLREVRVGVRLEHVQAAVGRQAQVDARVAAQGERAVDAPREPRARAAHAVRQVLRRPVPMPCFCLVLAVPLDLARRDAGHHLGQRAEVELPHRQRREPLVAESRRCRARGPRCTPRPARRTWSARG